MNKQLVCIFFLVSLKFNCQVIELHSIMDWRQTGGDQGYTLDGQHMKTSSAAKLLNPALFGKNGTYKKSIFITHDYDQSNSLTGITKEPTSVLFFFGWFNEIDPTFKKFTEDEMDSLYRWSVRGGKMLICAGESYPDRGIFSYTVNDWWDFTWADAVSTLRPTNEGKATRIFNGPFGIPGEVPQGGWAQGYFSTFPDDAIVLAENANGQATLIMDCKTLDVVVADVDAFTNVGSISEGALIQTNADALWCNTIAFLDELQPPPFLKKNGDQLELNAVYNSYKWFKDGQPLPVNEGATLTPVITGSYQVEVKLNGGCVLRSQQVFVSIPSPTPPPAVEPLPPDPPAREIQCDVFVPTAFSPDANGVNDALCVYSACMHTMEFNVYDQWGEQVFSSRDPKRCWDGSFGGKQLPYGVFAWTLKASLKNGKLISQKGNITLIR